MRSLPGFLFACVLGFYLYGVTGLVIGAGVGWVLSMGAESLVSYGEEKRRRDSIKSAEAAGGQLADIAATVKRMRAIQVAILDALPVEPYDILDMHTPRTEEDWKVIERRRWPLIRRRLVIGYGLSAAKVDKAKEDILCEHSVQHHLPRSDAALTKMVEAWRESERWAADYADNIQRAKASANPQDSQRPLGSL